VAFFTFTTLLKPLDSPKNPPEAGVKSEPRITWDNQAVLSIYINMLWQIRRILAKISNIPDYAQNIEPASMPRTPRFMRDRSQGTTR
jgi:hypothetical protein